MIHPGSDVCYLTLTRGAAVLADTLFKDNGRFVEESSEAECDVNGGLSDELIWSQRVTSHTIGPFANWRCTISDMYVDNQMKSDMQVETGEDDKEDPEKDGATIGIQNEATLCTQEAANFMPTAFCGTKGFHQIVQYHCTLCASGEQERL